MTGPTDSSAVSRHFWKFAAALLFALAGYLIYRAEQVLEKWPRPQPISVDVSHSEHWPASHEYDNRTIAVAVKDQSSPAIVKLKGGGQVNGFVSDYDGTFLWLGTVHEATSTTPSRVERVAIPWGNILYVNMLGKPAKK